MTKDKRFLAKITKIMTNPKVLLIFTFSFIIVLGIFLMHYVWVTSLDKTTERAMKLALTAEIGLHRDAVKKLEASSQDLDKPEYDQIKEKLIKIVRYNPEIHFAYLYTLIDDKIYFMVDSELPDSADYSPPGQEYFEGTETDKMPFYNGKPVITEPTTDRWGTWISVLVPIIDPDTGNTFAVFGIDFSADLWNNEAITRAEQMGFVILCLFFLLIAFFGLYSKNIAIRDEKNKLSFLNDKLSEKEEFFRTIFEQSPLGISFGNAQGDILEINPMFTKIAGRSKEELIFLGWPAITHPDDLQEDMDHFAKFSAGEINGYSMNKRYIKPDGSIVWVNITISPLKVNNNHELSHICMVEDITERIMAEQELRESERSKAVLLSNLPGMAYRCSYDKDWTMHFVSEGCYELTGYKPETLINNKEISFNDLIRPEYREVLWDIWTKTLVEKAVFKQEYEIITASGEMKWVFEQGRGIFDEQGRVKALEGLIIDINELKKREAEIRFLNYHDALTGLYNRRYFEQEKKRLDHKDYLPLSVIIGDINGLKLINDAMGHSEGDKLIIEIGKILLTCCHEGDVLARTGGDEFTILLPNTTNEMALKLIKSIGRACEDYKKTKDDPFHTSISLGCATKTEESESIDSVIISAEEYMYRYKLLQNKSLHSKVIASMKTTMFEKSQETEEHAQRLIEHSKAVGRIMNLSDEQLNELELLSALHDIGKIAISDSILNKPGKLTEEDWKQMKKHPEIGYRIAMTSPELLPIAENILCHHERWDGTGYPQGLKEEQIPLLSRIISIVDAYDAMTQDRPYQKAMSKEAAIKEIKDNAGTQFDPVISRLFIEYMTNSLI